MRQADDDRARGAMPEPHNTPPTQVSRRGLLLAGLGLPLLLTSCRAGHTAIADPAESAEGAVVLALTGAPTSLDFTRTDGVAIPLVLMGNIYEGLVRINDSGGLDPLLAEDWTVSDDRLVYTFTLRTGVTFTNGARFDAESAVFSIERVKSEAWTNGLSAAMDVVASATAEDTHVLRVELTEPSNQWLWFMGTLIGAMMTEDGVDDLATDPVGTGPFTVDRWARGQSLGFVANPDYWGEPPASSAVTIQYFTDTTASTNALQAGDVDAVYDMQSPELTAVLEEDDDLVTETGATSGQILLSMNNRVAPFDDLRVRRAVMYAMDRQAIIDTAWGGFGDDTGGAPAPPTDPWYVESSRYPHDPSKARELLREAGQEDLHITFKVPTRPYAQQISEIVVSLLREVGITATIEAVEFPALWLDEVFGRHDYQMSVIDHAEARDLPVLFGDPDYYLGFDDERTRDLLARADREPPEEQTELMRAAVERIVDQAASDTLFIFPNIVVRRRRLQGLPASRPTDELLLAGAVKGEGS
ncbi:ABC transporter substrate-binding protein [Nocardiopsis oceani]